MDTEVLRRRVDELKQNFGSPFDFGNDIRTKPARVFRRYERRIRLMRIPQDLQGKSVLDIGAWDGFFSFEMERRGASRVLAIDTWGGDGKALECLLLAREHFRSKVEYKRIDADDISPEGIGTFDLVLCSGVLYHFRHPLHTLERIRRVTKERLILETNSLILGMHNSTPLITFFPGDRDDTFADQKRYPWHWGAFPTQSWVSYALTAAGFARHEVVYTPSFRRMKRLAAVLTNTPQASRLIVHAFVEDADVEGR